MRTKVGFSIHVWMSLFKTSYRVKIIQLKSRSVRFCRQKMILRKLIEKICNGLVNLVLCANVSLQKSNFKYCPLQRESSFQNQVLTKSFGKLQFLGFIIIIIYM
jgi:hypothetical protein